MTDNEIEASARFAAYERILEYLLTSDIAQKSPETWPITRSAIIGPGIEVIKGVASIEQLERIEFATSQKIGEIFDRASAWAARAQS